MLVAINSFVRRQTAESPFTHFEGEEDSLLRMVEESIKTDNFTQGYRDGVILVNLPPSDFFTGLVELKEGDSLVGKFEARVEGEAPRQSIRARKYNNFPGKQPAKKVQIVCYRKDVLAEDGHDETDAEWEIVSLNGYPTGKVAPIDPMTLMHNHFGSDGGTDTNMTAEEFERQLRESFSYWKNKALLE